jgi:tyrosine aminotransferase
LSHNYIPFISTHSVHGSLKEVEAGANRLAQVNLGASNLAQAVVPTLLNPSTPGMNEWKHNLRVSLERQANCLCNSLSQCPGLKVIPPQGAMYAIVKIDTNALNVQDDKDFVSKLLEEENVFVLPGSSFGVENMFRVVYCSAEPVLEMAANRIESFCRRHSKECIH